jgi:transmembrane sensor
VSFLYTIVLYLYINQAMSKQDFISLYEKFLSGKCSEEEKQLLETYYSEIKLMDNNWQNSLGDEQAIKATLLNNIKASMDAPVTEVPVQRTYGTWLKYAASIIILITAGIFSWQYLNNKPVRHSKALKQIAKTIIKPGSNQAYLTLANGQSIVIHKLQNGEVKVLPGVTIRKMSDNTLSYTYTNTGNAGATLKPDSNSLTVPNGGVFQTILSDGTKVWLNAGSSLKFPVTFAGKERKVVLNGEAYFEVAKNRQMPFKVMVKGVEVQVLGTHFNVMGYADENAVRTTLIEGSVQLQAGTSQALLVPGEQGSLKNNAGEFLIRKVNTDDVTAWKSGFFVFDNENIQNIMSRIRRWYDVEVVYQGKPTKSSFGGAISRYKDMDVVLKALQVTGSVHFKVEGRRITVMD